MKASNFFSALIQIKQQRPPDDAACSEIGADMGYRPAKNGIAAGGNGMHDFAAWLADSGVSHDLQVAGWIIPLSQSIHILAIAMLLSSMLMIDLRILGVAARSESMAQMSRRFAP